MAEITHNILTKSKIIQSVALAIILGTTILVLAILPAEYGIDPTGLGKTLGFSKLHTPENATNLSAPKQVSIIKMERAGSDPKVERPAEADAPPPTEQYEQREDSMEITIPAGKGLEYKVYLLKYGKLKYEWIADNGIVFFDFHGEVNTEKPTSDVYYESYTMAYSNNMVGTFLAPYEGKHGWYFKNDTDKDIKIAMRLKGEYVL